MPSTEAQKKATIKYMQEKLEKIEFRVPKGKKKEIRAHAEAQGMSLTAYIKALIEQESKISL